MASAKEPASLAPSAKGLAVGPAFYVPREAVFHMMIVTSFFI